jgi:TrpR family trp operon transcriptional repressor
MPLPRVARNQGARARVARTHVARAAAADCERAARREIEAMLASVTDAATMGRLLEELLTKAELHDLSPRLRLLKLLRAGRPQREIAARLGVSLCKITRGSRVLKQPGSAVAALLRRAPAGARE